MGGSIKYFRLDVAIRKMVEDEVGIRYKGWDKDIYTSNLKSILEYIGGNYSVDNVENIIMDNCWEIEGR